MNNKYDALDNNWIREQMDRRLFSSRWRWRWCYWWKKIGHNGGGGGGAGGYRASGYGPSPLQGVN